jgi:hypothetical protein
MTAVCRGDRCRAADRDQGGGEEDGREAAELTTFHDYERLPCPMRLSIRTSSYVHERLT